MSETQLERANTLLRKMRAHTVELRGLAGELGHVLDEAQNQPPEGLSDGTITEPFFNALRKFELGIRDLPF